MAVNYELLNKGGISLSTNFDAIIDKPLDARQVVPGFDGLQSLIDNGGAYAGMVTYVTSEKRLYEVYDDNGTLKYKAHAYTEDELKALIGQQTTAAMEFKGATATLPENSVKGDMYKVAGENISITIDDVAAKIGDSIVYDGEKWYLIPSGDDIEDTWRTITGVANDATLSFVDGNNTTADVKNNGTVTFHHNKLTVAPSDVATEEDKKTRTYLTAVEVDEYGHVTNYKTATENVEDTNTTYEFECQVEEGHSNVHFSVKASDAEQTQEICLDAYTRNETDAAIKVVSDVIDNNKATWDLAGTAVQTADFNTFKGENTQAIADAVAPKLDAETFNTYIDGKSMSDEDLKKYADDAASAVDTKLTQYGEAHAGDYTNKQIDDAIDADVAAAIAAEVARANGAYDVKGDAAKAQAAAEATAAGALATARTEITTEIGTAISSEVSRADGKYEEKGVAQGIVDALKLSETYEPIGAETRAIAAAEGKVNTLAGNVYTKTETYNKSEIEALLTWGEF